MSLITNTAPHHKIFWNKFVSLASLEVYPIHFGL